MGSSVLKALAKLYESDHMVRGAKSFNRRKVIRVEIPGQVPQDRRGTPATGLSRAWISIGNMVLIWQLANSYPPRMDINKMLAELRAERDQLGEAILTLERLAVGRGKRRGRPPKWMTAVKRRGRPPGSKNKPKATRH